MQKRVDNKSLRILLDDETFIQWVLSPTEELNTLWEERISGNEEQKENILKLKKILKALTVVEPEINQEDKDVVWRKIEARIALSEKKSRKAYTLLYRWGISVAAFLVLAVGGYWFFMRQASGSSEIDYKLFATIDESVFNAGNINIILADKQRIDIEKDSALIAYNEKGQINVDSEQVSKEVPDKEESGLNQLIVPYGKTTSLILSDGTKIWVNAGSNLVYPVVFEGNKREIYLQGEALLDVAKKDGIPFIIKTDQVKLNVLGTVLNVSAYSDASAQSVILVSGSVEVQNHKQKNAYRLEPNQKFSYSASEDEITIQQVNVDDYISWIHGYQTVSNETLNTVFQKISRHFNVKFIYDKEKLNHIYVSGKLDLRTGLQYALDYISVTTPIEYRIVEELVHIDLIK